MSGNTPVSNTNIRFSDLREKRGNESFTGGSVLGSTNISLSEFRGTKFKDESQVPVNNASTLSINSHFKGKTFSREHTTDGFRAYSNWSSHPTKLTGSGSSSDSYWSGSNTSTSSGIIITGSPSSVTTTYFGLHIDAFTGSGSTNISNSQT